MKTEVTNLGEHMETAEGHKKSDSAQRKADLEKAKSKGRLAVPPQAVHAVHEVGHSSASTGDEVHSAGGSAGISVTRTAPGEVAYIWVLSAASMRNKHYPKGIMLDSGAAMSVCPVDYHLGENNYRFDVVQIFSN